MVIEKHTYTKEEIKQMFAEIAISQKETAISQKETDRRWKKTDIKFQKLEIFLDKICKQLGSIGANNGAVAEEYFFYGFSKNMEVNNIKYDYIEKNKERVLKKLRGEYDVVLINSSSNLIIEVKYKLHPNDVKIFHEKKLPKFKKLFPEYKDY